MPRSPLTPPERSGALPNLGTTLRALRDARGMTQQALVRREFGFEPVDVSLADGCRRTEQSEARPMCGYVLQSGR